MRTTKTIKIRSTNRADIRRELTNLFLDEVPGQGKGELCSHYIYFVEEFPENHKIYLKRPARLNKGFDFEVHVENMSFDLKRIKSRPSHSDIIDDLVIKQKEDPVMFQQTLCLIDDLFNCKKVEQKQFEDLKFESGFPIEVILKVIKWLFIEQDITYWNWSGRNMFYGGINKEFKR